MQLLNFNVIKITLCLITGIYVGYICHVSLDFTVYATGFFFAFLFIAYFIARKQFEQKIWFGSLVFTVMFFIGILTVTIHDIKNDSNHYTNLTSLNNTSSKVITFRIRNVLKSNDYYDKYIIDFLEINTHKVKGKALLNIQKDSTTTTLNVDAIYACKTAFKDIGQPLNPNQFDYKNYLDKKYIYHQLFTTNKSLVSVSSKIHTLFGIAHIIRKHINDKLKHHNFTPNQLAIINALLLGQRQNISKDVYSSYTNAGAIHILAVSGLHVGIVLILLNFIFKPIERFKHGKLFKTMLLIIILWSFALIAGLSASVTRAVTMFSIVAIGMNLKRPTNIYNTLAISMFVILLFKPLFLFDVGFQLSYLAVFSIVVIDPILYKLWQPKNKIINLYWHTFTVTVSAQIGIIPISLYYFHQFPGLFFISNLVIIPFLGVILGFGILVITLSVLNSLPTFLAALFGQIITLMNNFVNWISLHEQFIFKDIAFSLLYVLVAYMCIIALIRLFLKRNYASLRLSLFSILLVQATCIYTNYNKTSNTFIVFHKNKYSLIGNVSNNAIMVSHNFDSLTAAKNNIITNYTIGNHIKNVKTDNTILPFYSLKNKTFLIIDSLGIYDIKSFQPDFVLLRQSPKINLNRLIDALKPKQIIADGSNYKSYIKQWEAICKKQKRPFHQTRKKGAFILRY